MISKATYSLDWIKEVSAKLGKRVDPKLLEKAIYAFALLEQLSINGLDFTFKGGTSLLLTTSPPRRFSIDIDIISETSVEALEKLLDKITSVSVFTRWEDDTKRKHSIEAPVGHFKLYYKSKVDTLIPEEPILLDVLFTPNPYPRVKEYMVEHEWLITEGKSAKVNVPVFESLLGDKLTAFAPNTTGILYTKDRPVEIIKQLYDIGLLFDLAQDFKLVKKSYLKIVGEEIVYRKLNIDWKAVLNDTKETCLILAQRDIERLEFVHLQKGITNITNFIIERFKLEEAIVAAAKAAYLCTLLEKDNIATSERFTSPSQVFDLVIENPSHNKLNKLKKTNPEAFYYWYQSVSNS
jgi:hypothetical protein